jgi:hypothetical protein
MKLTVLKNRDKKFTVSERVVKKLKTVYRVTGQENLKNENILKNGTNDQDLENEKYDYQTNNNTVKIDNVDWKKLSLNKALYKPKQEKKSSDIRIVQLLFTTG